MTAEILVWWVEIIFWVLTWVAIYWLKNNDDRCVEAFKGQIEINYQTRQQINMLQQMIKDLEM